jgi:lipoate-protein ligase A
VSGPDSVAPTVNEDLLEEYLREGKPVYRLYEPDAVCVVMGAAGREGQDVHLERARLDAVPVLRRRGGGGTVVLSPGQLVLALVTEVGSPFQNLEYFRTLNHWFRTGLAALGVEAVEDRGTSDLAIRERKILGTSLYRRRLLLFYQASLLVDNELELFERYLPAPARAPEYRAGRGHADFCTTLRRAGYPLQVSAVLAALREVVEVELPRLR